jgi:alkanesulfonate monooxygenase SsuD/methylene tetrahydromethanopterin reductase-like flavin-dependent oxidoreductase (luciferase family)
MRPKDYARGLDAVKAAASDAAFALNIPAEMWASHGVQHPLGDDFAGGQDLVPQTLDEQTVLSYIKDVPVSLLKDGFLVGTPDDVIDQATEWRDHGLRYLSSRLQCQHSAAEPAESLRVQRTILQDSARAQETVKVKSAQL